MADHKKEPGGYEVGYGKPPKSGQFKKGHKGFSSTKPKRHRPLEDLIAEEAARNITVSIDGNPLTMPQIDLVLRALFQKAMKDDMRAAHMVLQGVGALPPEPQSQAQVTAEDLAIRRGRKTRRNVISLACRGPGCDSRSLIKAHFVPAAFGRRLGENGASITLTDQGAKRGSPALGYFGKASHHKSSIKFHRAGAVARLSLSLRSRSQSGPS